MRGGRPRLMAEVPHLGDVTAIFFAVQLERHTVPTTWPGGNPHGEGHGAQSREQRQKSCEVLRAAAYVGYGRRSDSRFGPDVPGDDVPDDGVRPRDLGTREQIAEVGRSRVWVVSRHEASIDGARTGRFEQEQGTRVDAAIARVEVRNAHRRRSFRSEMRDERGQRHDMRRL